VVKRWNLPPELMEISGLAYLDESRFVCIQDESGSVYIYNTADSRIEKKIDFAGSGDYEGLALIGDTVWVLRSDGMLYEINSVQSNVPAVREFDTPLSAEHDAEGLCYDPKHNRLLVAIKDHAPGVKDYKGIYAFNLATYSMQADPVLKIDLSHKLLRGNHQKKNKNGESILPSAIAIHPLNGDIYITEGRNAKLLILDSMASVKELYHLDKTEFFQPEGISFSPAGQLYISNEGAKQPGNILSVKLQPGSN
jgi:uncharacterized protein YjiK